MKNILVPTDFSDCAGYAFEAAVQLARHFDAQIHLLSALHAHHPILLATATGGQDAVSGQAEVVRDQMETWAIPYNDIAFSFAVKEGKLSEIVRDYVGAHGIDLVVMGSHGASGKNEYFIGSNTQKVVRLVHCPVLVLKEPIKSLRFDNVMYASSFYRNEEKAFLKFKDMVKSFVPEIHLVMVQTSSLFDPPYALCKEVMQDYQKLCEPLKSQIHIFKDYTVEQGIRTFSEELGIQLIGMSNHFRHPVKRMLVGSNVEALVNHSQCPVLSIDYDTTED